MAIVLDGTSGITNDSGYTGDGVSFADSTPANTLVTTSGGNVGIGTSSPNIGALTGTAVTINGSSQSNLEMASAGVSRARIASSASDTTLETRTALPLVFGTNATERARITSDGVLLVGKTSTSGGINGCNLSAGGSDIAALFTSDSATCATLINRQTTDGVLVSLRQANTQEGTISVSGTTVSYNGGHLSRWAQTLTAKDESLVKGTVLSNLDEMNVYTDAEGNPIENEQLNKVKVSDVEGDANVAGVFVNWDHDEDHNVDEINMAMTGDMIIRIAQGVTVQRGDLLMSAGDGTAKPQGDDIVRSKTIAKVTSTHVTCTYADGSFCVPCVLMAC
jgi:hypothetical protein